MKLGGCGRGHRPSTGPGQEQQLTLGTRQRAKEVEPRGGQAGLPQLRNLCDGGGCSWLAGDREQVLSAPFLLRVEVVKLTDLGYQAVPQAMP